MIKHFFVDIFLFSINFNYLINDLPLNFIGFTRLKTVRFLHILLNCFLLFYYYFLLPFPTHMCERERERKKKLSLNIPLYRGH